MLDSNRKAAFRDYSWMGGTCSLRWRLRGGDGEFQPEVPATGWRAAMTCRVSSSVPALIAAIRSSPIVVWLGARFFSASEWARIRKSPEVDAYVLAWIASHVPGPRRRPRRFM
jgi:hypothetical protein